MGIITYFKKYRNAAFGVVFVLLIIAYIMIGEVVRDFDYKALHFVSLSELLLQESNSGGTDEATKLPLALLLEYSNEDAQNDKRRWNSSQLFEDAVKSIRNFPHLPIITDKNETLKVYNISCSRLPTLYDIEFDNDWQMLYTWNGTMYFYGAYYDNRTLTRTLAEPHRPAVRLLGLMDWKLYLENTTSYYCQFWFRDEYEPIISPVTNTEYIFQDGRRKHQIFLLACYLPSSHIENIPLSVSVVEKPCTLSSINMRVQYESTTQQKDFAVCVKSFDFEEQRHLPGLVEWIELLRILRADTIFFYLVPGQTNALKQYYEDTNYVDITSFTAPGGLPNDSRLKRMYFSKGTSDEITNSIILYNDCLYRNIHSYKHIAILDPTEIIVPLQSLNWQDVISSLKASQSVALDFFHSMCFQEVCFFDKGTKVQSKDSDIPNFMQILRNVYRLPGYSKNGSDTNCFYNTNGIILIKDKFLKCYEQCNALHVEPKIARMHKYKSQCSANFGESVLDDSLLRYKGELVNKTSDVLKL